MEKVHYSVSSPDGEEWETKDYDIAKTAFKKGSQVVEIKEILSCSEFTSVRIIISTQMTAGDQIKRW